MEISNRLKKVIYNKLYKDLSNVEIIQHKDSIWFIDRENKYWYFEYEKSGFLWWKYDFFNSFFLLFSIKQSDFEPIISEWVEEVLNCKVNTTKMGNEGRGWVVEEVLNCKVNTTVFKTYLYESEVEEVLNCKVNTTDGTAHLYGTVVEEVLNCKVNTTQRCKLITLHQMEEILNNDNG
jgi:hypothetical protein